MGKKSCIGYIVGGLIAVFACLCVGNFVYTKIFPTNSASTQQSDTVAIDWEQLYPFKESNMDKEIPAQNDSDIQDNAEHQGIASRLEAITDKVMEKINNFPNKLPGYNEIALFSGELKVAWAPEMRNHLESLQYVMTEDRYFVLIAEELKIITDELVHPVVSLKDYCEERQTPFLYLSCPKKIAVGGNEPINIAYNQNIDDYISALEKEGVDAINGRKLIEEQNLNWRDLFYRTDHHWNLDAGLWMAQTLAETMNEKYGFDLDTSCLEKDLYERVTYADAMFGSGGHAVGRAYADNEDFDLLVPTFETQFRVQNMDKDYDEIGEWDEVMYDREKLLEIQSEGGGYVYETLLGGNRPLTKITNLNNPDGIKILMIRDSFSLAVAPYLAMSVGEIDLIDVRKGNGEFSGSVRTYIEETSPDVVIMMCSDILLGYTYQ